MGTAVENVVIVGGGIAGLATAVALKRAGIDALVLERSEELRATGGALALFPNAWLALDAFGVSHKLASYTPSSKGYVTDIDTGQVQEISFIKANGDSVGPRAVHRKALLEALAGELPDHSIRFCSKISAIDTQQHEGSSIAIVHMKMEQSSKQRLLKVLIGCDGAHSVVSRWLGLSEPVHSGRSGFRGLAVYPQGHGLKQIVQKFVGSGRRAGLLPVNYTDVYWFFAGITRLTPAEGMSLAEDPKDIQKEFLDKYANGLPSIYLDVVQHSDLSTLSWAPLIFRYPWNIVFGTLSRQNITVAGDAMHPMTPDLGQGGLSALQDAVILGRHIGTLFKENRDVVVPKEMSGVLKKYAEERRWLVAMLITGSYISGCVQQGGSSWGLKFIRDAILYKFFFPKIMRYANNVECGKRDF